METSDVSEAISGVGMAMQRTVVVDRKADTWSDLFCPLLMPVLQLFAIGENSVLIVKSCLLV